MDTLQVHLGGMRSLQGKMDLEQIIGAIITGAGQAEKGWDRRYIIHSQIVCVAHILPLTPHSI